MPCRHTCNSNCASCITENNCTECKAGFYGPDCRHKCSLGCLNKACDQISGLCHCVSGYSGALCKERCPSSCNACITPENCTQCVSGFYGKTCKTTCSLGCTSSECDMITGRCDSCREGFFGENCEPEYTESVSPTLTIVSTVSNVIAVLVVLMIGAVVLLQIRRSKMQTNIEDPNVPMRARDHGDLETATQQMELYEDLRHDDGNGENNRHYANINNINNPTYQG
ncbi:cell death abnormality protein 1-like [Mya arenaria]|uniref:cell death abnormality protein 1-like n=1 Tax=Mya arenaria TaxID=6604 RepID=UPI0022DEEB97|nr:cell death abnormality protein 1-like [Mya arenaria]